ncbi:CMD domain protein [Stella sp.]|uniref:CMD domain protein n=1 Tax=Stella sp. TaxID=2912054 RepID=UPI0035B04BDA
MTDVIDDLLGIRPGSPLDAIRARRPETRAQAQASYDALFRPADPGGVTAAERFAVATFVAALHGATEVAGHYRAALAPALAEAVDAAVAAATGTGPYGRYPTGPLTAEDQPGASWAPAGALAAALGPRLAAALGHMHLLVLHPRDGAPPALQALLDAGWTTTDIVTLSQIASFVAFQLRAVAGLRALATRL